MSRWAVALASLALLPAEVGAVGAVETGTIRGQLADERGRVTYAGHAVVFLCDAESGLPILSTTKKPLVPGERVEGAKEFWHAVTTDRGVFEFKDVPAGSYRLVAQSWTGMEGLPEFAEQPSTIVTLHGVADGVQVMAGDITHANPRKLGDGTLKIVNDPEEAHAFLLISRGRRLGDGVLGPAGWGRAFLSGLVGATRMEQPYVTVVGLPEGEEIHVGLLNYDNNPGVGGDSYLVGKDRVVRLEIFATWSNGKHEPPERLAKLTDHLDETDVSVSSLVGLEGSDARNRKLLRDLLASDPDRLIQVGELGQFRLADVLAASSYRNLQRYHRARRVP